MENSNLAKIANKEEPYFLVVSRLYDYKRIDLAVKACLEAGKKLIVVGDGPERRNLEYLFKEDDGIYMVGYISDQALKFLYQGAEALLFCGEEDYGLIPVEAMASGCPVIAFNKGGVKDTIQHGKTGYLFNDYDELVKIVREYKKSAYSKVDLINRAREFDFSHFENRFLKLLKNI